MKESFTLKIKFNVKPSEIYEAWLDSSLHSEMTGGAAECGKEIGQPFSTWDGYISGKNIDLKPNREIIQSWRTTEFDVADEDSLLTIQFNEIKDGTELVLIHTNIPEGQNQYKKGWKDFYFDPMKTYFEE